MRRAKRGSTICHLKERAEEDLKETKVAAAWFNVETADNKCQEIRQRDPHDEYLLLNHN